MAFGKTRIQAGTAAPAVHFLALILHWQSTEQHFYDPVAQPQLQFFNVSAAAARCQGGAETY
jgi:hypothetical protein